MSITNFRPDIMKKNIQIGGASQRENYLVHGFVGCRMEKVARNHAECGFI
jgi:hypothetical protein